MRVEMIRPGHVPEIKENVLYLADTQEVIDEISAKGGAVAGYLHENNSHIWLQNVSQLVEHPEEMEEDDFLKIYQRIKGIPWMIAETDRLLIRESVTEDVREFYGIYKGESARRFLDPLKDCITEEISAMESYIQNMYGFYGYGIWTVVERQRGQVIGRVGFSLREGEMIPEIGFVIGETWQHKGYAYEACLAVISYAKTVLGFEQIQALVHPDNKVSKALCQKIGMHLTDRYLDNMLEIWHLNLSNMNKK